MHPRKLTLLLASTLTVMSGATVAAALPLIRQTFADTPDVDVLARLVLTVPALFIAVASPVAGYLVDRLGRLRLLYVGLALYAVGGVGGGLVSSLPLLLASRALLGVAVALVMTVTATLIADYFDGEERGDLLGKQAAAMSLGGIVFIVGGGLLADVSWRAPFGIYLLSLLMLPLVARYLEEPPRDTASGPGPASAKTTTAAAKTTGAETATGTAAPAFAKTPPAPAAPFWGLSVVMFATMFLAMVVFYLTPVQLPFLLEGFGASSTMTGVAVAATTLSGAVASFSFARVKAAIGPWWVLALAFGLLGLGYVLLSFMDSYWAVVATVLVSGFGLGFIMPNVNQLVMQAAPLAQRGRVLGLLSSCLFLGQFVSPIAVAPVVAAYDLPTAFLWAGALALAMAAAAGVWAVARSASVPLASVSGARGATQTPP